MTIQLTPHHVAAVYDCLRAFEPISRFHLLPADEVEFIVTRARKYYGQAVVSSAGQATIWVSSLNIGHFNTLAHVTAHEMVHLHQFHSGTNNNRIEHNAEFRKLMAEACAIHGWDGAMI